MADQPESLAAALAQFQANLPTVRKGETATVPTKTGGKYTYTYASLADVNAVVLPALGRVGLSFTCRITLTEAGRLVLAYALLHGASNERLEGEYPIPMEVQGERQMRPATAQEIGSAVTYGRRYVLCALTGVAADDDDDGAAASVPMKATRPAKQQARAAKATVTPYVDDDMGAEQVEVVFDAAGAAMVADAFAAEIDTTWSAEELTSLAKSIAAAARRGEITAAQKDRLIIAGQARRAELDQGVPV